SPRAGLQLLAMAKARAVIDERDFVVPDDVQEVAGPVLAHRLALRRGATQSPATVIADILAHVSPPAPRRGRCAPPGAQEARSAPVSPRQALPQVWAPRPWPASPHCSPAL